MKDELIQRLSILKGQELELVWQKRNMGIRGMLAIGVCLDKLIIIILFFPGHKKR